MDVKRCGAPTFMKKKIQAKSLPGKPEMIVQNMPGADHMIAAHYD